MAPDDPLRSQLFTIRLWQEDLGGDQPAWRGKVQHVLRGDACYFQGLENLVQAMLFLIDDRLPAQGGSEADR